MTENDMIIGELKAFKDYVGIRMSMLEAKIEDLQSFKWKIIGISAAVSVAGSALISAMTITLKIIK